jgi:hypothetical protein
MNKLLFKVFILVLSIQLTLTGCFEISGDSLYEDYNSKLVIEGIIDSGLPPYYIKVSKSAPADGEVDFFPVNDARILVNSTLGDGEIARWVSPGVYELGSFTGNPGVTYSLLVSVDNEDFIAEDVMPEVPVLDSVEINYRINYTDGTGYYFKFYFLKPLNVTNYYKFEITLNDSLYNGYSDLILIDDAYSENLFEYILPYAFNTNDAVSIVIHAISPIIYTYYYGLTRQTTNVFSNIQPPILNPESNIQTNVLGYFQASSKIKIDTLINP